MMGNLVTNSAFIGNYLKNCDRVVWFKKIVLVRFKTNNNQKVKTSYEWKIENIFSDASYPPMRAYKATHFSFMSFILRFHTNVTCSGATRILSWRGLTHKHIIIYISVAVGNFSTRGCCPKKYPSFFAIFFFFANFII